MTGRDAGAAGKPEERLEVRSMFGLRTREPLVVIVVGEHAVQVSPAKAREVAGMLYACAEAAEADAFIVAFAQTAGGDDRQAGLMLREFRRLREGKTDGTD